MLSPVISLDPYCSPVRVPKDRHCILELCKWKPRRAESLGQDQGWRNAPGPRALPTACLACLSPLIPYTWQSSAAVSDGGPVIQDAETQATPTQPRSLSKPKPQGLWEQLLTAGEKVSEALRWQMAVRGKDQAF